MKFFSRDDIVRRRVLPGNRSAGWPAVSVLLLALSLAASPEPVLSAMNLQSWHLTGNAVLMNPDQILLVSSAGEKGAAWAPTPLDLLLDFDLQCSVFLGASPGDSNGLAFVLQNDARGNTALGDGGLSLGYGDRAPGGLFTPSDGIHPSIDLELDTQDDGVSLNADEPSFEHLAVFRDGLLEASALAGPVSAAPNPTPGTLADGRTHQAHVHWDAGRKTITLDLENGAAVTYTRDLVRDIFNGNSKVLWGWTSGSGEAGGPQSFRVLGVSLGETPTPTVVPPPAGSPPFVYPNPLVGKRGRLSYDPTGVTGIRVWVYNTAYDLIARFEGGNEGGLDIQLVGTAPGVYYLIVESRGPAGKKRWDPLKVYLP